MSIIENNITIIGSGAWGTALGIIFSQKFNVNIITRSEEIQAEINNSHTNSKYLPTVTLPQNLKCFLWDEYIAEIGKETINTLVIVVPSQGLISTIEKIANSKIKFNKMLIATKGLDYDSNDFFSNVIIKKFNYKPAFLSGPNFAGEIARKLPAAGVVASEDYDLAVKIAEEISCNFYQAIPSNDYITIQLSGGFKNILAIYSGYIIGRRLGDNYRAVACTDAISEFTNLVTYFGGNVSSVYSLSCLGDIMLSCFSAQSRNFQYGNNLGRKIMSDSIGLVEGVLAAKTMAKMTSNIIDNYPLLKEILTLILKEDKQVL